MSAFELNKKRNSDNDHNEHHDHSEHHNNNNNNRTNNIDARFVGEDPELRRLREECIIALKVYDSCRNQDYLTTNEIGPARAAESKTLGDEHYNVGDVVVPPSCAASVTLDKLKIKKILILDKEPNSFKNGYWDISLKYVFEYRLTFREADGDVIGTIKGNSIFNKKVTLFGSIGTDLVIATDLFVGGDGNLTLDADPFIIAEAKAVSLETEIKYAFRRVSHGHGHGDEDIFPEPSSVSVTLGLFTIIKLFRIVNLTVESRGFCIPPEAQEVSPLNLFQFFEELDFPMDVFAPPQKPEFFAGIKNNIPHTEAGAKSTSNCPCNEDKNERNDFEKDHNRAAFEKREYNSKR